VVSKQAAVVRVGSYNRSDRTLPHITTTTSTAAATATETKRGEGEEEGCCI